MKAFQTPSKALWDKVQERLYGKTQRKDKTKKHLFTYRGFLSCGECGCSITAEKQKGHIYYRCTKARGKCGQPYIREEELEIQLAKVFDPIKIDNQTSEFIVRKLSELYKDDKEYQEKIAKNLKAKLTHLKQEKKKLFRKMVNDQIDDEEMYQELREEIDHKIIEIGEQVTKLSQSTYDWVEQSSNLLKLANKAKKLFLEAKREEKYKLLESVSSNRVLKARKAHYSYKKPFDILVKMSNRTDWRGGSYDLRTFMVKCRDKVEKLLNLDVCFRNCISVESVGVRK